MGAMAVYIYSLNILPYTVRIMIKDSTVIRRLPSSVTIHKGMDSSIPTDSIFSTISAGSSVTPPFVIPDCAMIVDTIPCTMENRAVINSMPYMMAPCASANRIKALRACSGFFMSAKFHLRTYQRTPSCPKTEERYHSVRGRDIFSSAPLSFPLQ